MRTLIICLLLFGNATFAQSIFNPELFIEIREPGKYEITVNDEVVVSKTGRFRFYDLYEGRTFVSISSGGKVLLKKEVYTHPGTRTIAQYSRRNGLRTIEELPVSDNGRYILDNWNGYISDRPSRPDDGRPGYAREMNKADFDRLYNTIKKESFDDSRLDLLLIALRGNRVSVNQLAILLKSFSFDEKRLTAAFNSYNSVYDPGNFYQLGDVFDFISSKNKLNDFLLKRG